MFVDRVQELAALQRSYDSGQAELFVLYGRRRVGKTELLRTFCQDKRHLFFVADLGTEANALSAFTREVATLAYGDPGALGAFPTWDAAFQLLARLCQTERLVVVVDELPYLINANPAISSILQRLWDTSLRQTQLLLILCGSYVGMMERHVLSYRAPLYGRRTAQWKLGPLSFPDAALLLPGYSAADQVRAYALLGGVPAYLLQFDDRLSVGENVEQRVLAAGTFLHEEPRFLLLQELGDPARYFAIIEAIAGGRTRHNDIAQAAGLAATSVPFYLGTLRELDLVERVVPATETQPHKSKRSIYQLKDHYFRFWFRFVHPNRSALERGATAAVRRQVEAQLDQFTGLAFERICQEHLWRLAGSGRLGFMPRAIGRWWDEREEIDVVAVGERDLLLGECKWTGDPVGIDVLAGLERKAPRVLRRAASRTIRYALFSRAGFTPALLERAARDGVLLFELSDLILPA